ncbi:AcrR family transcriptional regulator [Geodermatophilus bullaregiensis]|uniref:TetR/AcrR family transcriptional regulator n=1 Tax=Geodermatophilus bullaregiensis TaxID=1564160 RepID=UPI00195CE3B1|nr:TetR/AcrR family transcriptional regulator [Geodermatophilus bullaregiensis]MBM7808848.1 AcrR family transcriptional regulator [Geodermatophilus bullaregiensis]
MAADRTTTPARERLLEAADRLFYARGIAATGVDAVLQLAGASPATLYAHFAGKDGLVAAYLERRHHRWRATWDAVLAGAEDPVDRLLSVLDALVLFRRQEGATRGCAFLAAAAELPAADHPARAWIEADTTLLHHRLHELALASGADDPRALVAELVLVYDGTLAAYARGAPDPVPAARELARHAIRRHSVTGSA